MEKTVTFWLDNKMSSGFKVAEVGSQALVSYREKFYVVEGGVAKMKGSRPLHFSKTSMPSVWKKALKGIVMPVDAEEENLPVATLTKKERIKMKKAVPSASNLSEAPLQAARPEQVQAKQSAPAGTSTAVKPSRAVSKPQAKPVAQTVVVAACPNCNHKHDLPLDKGKNGKAFFVVCTKCTTEFAVRFVPVTMYQAQVAAFS